MPWLTLIATYACVASENRAYEVYSPEPRDDAFCSGLNFNISKLDYYTTNNVTLLNKKSVNKSIGQGLKYPLIRKIEFQDTTPNCLRQLWTKLYLTVTISPYQ